MGQSRTERKLRGGQKELDSFFVSARQRKNRKEVKREEKWKDNKGKCSCLSPVLEKIKRVSRG